ncbi:MAG TPA: (deoxy)nucleoside triphosphate pyrophosphohydrolase [Flavobacteriaceae bacterium]|nr:(deoxy)nucleoside triphosphate pyrophosphohydrolase [Flavobacteriaceae bacterium]
MLHVTCAVIQKENKFLICQRSKEMKLPLKWEFPGGKIEEGEDKKECLKREVKEELGLNIEVLAPLEMVEHHYPEFSISLYPFMCKIKSGELSVAEHAQVKWVGLDELDNFDWAEADLPILVELKNLLSTKEE